MTLKNMKNIAILNLVAVLTISVIGTSSVYAEEPQYKYADDVSVVTTFTFRDGVETYKYPIFVMIDDFVANSGSQIFRLQGTVEPSPLLHRALDDAFKHKQNRSFDWNSKYFSVTADFIKNGTSVKKLNYAQCEINDYRVTTLNDSYESYTSSSSGFAIVNSIDFLCGGIDLITPNNVSYSHRTPFTTVDYGTTSFKFQNDIRTFVTFEFDKGVEKIEFPVFHLSSGYGEDTRNTSVSFTAQGIVGGHSLLNEAIENARKVSGFKNGPNTDFEALVQFVSGDKVLRELDFRDCRINSYKLTTLFDKEEGFTGKSGFAYVDNIGVECIGLSPKNTMYENMIKEVSWKNTMLEHRVTPHEFPTGTGPRAVATFTYMNGVEIVDFPLFIQGDVLVKSNPTFTLQGMVGETPMLYKRADDNLKMTSATGTNPVLELFQVDINLMYGDESVRGFKYADCRVTDYEVQTKTNVEETYFKVFPLTNVFEFECTGYKPYDPVSEKMSKSYTKANTMSTSDLRKTHQWGPDFYVK
ncbi:MAG: hypothetical protein COW27_06130 [Nitrosopumilales archaeon CG15_BIG_FIL_POST_REV_8_21_14_020_37_12]|nr:MAG: hypothetical protein COW27_06130 [Nitrosopumilales archaeon CG15_BIG_FIL_POST_REV_8_21_14_020_37_12]